MGYDDPNPSYEPQKFGLKDVSPRVLVVLVDPIGKPRQTRSDKWRKRPAVMAYRAFADTMRRYANRVDFVVPESGLEVEFNIAMPASWSRKKRAAMLFKPHQSKPDIDNLLKSVLDSLCAEDCTIWSIGGAKKVWAEKGRVILRSAA